MSRPGKVSNHLVSKNKSGEGFWQRVGDREIFIWSYGQGSPLVILHGWGQGSKRWRKPARLISEKGFRVFLPDLPGFGQSPPPDRPWRFEDYLLFLSNLLGELKLKRVTLIGHSFGGQLAVGLSSFYPELTKSLVLIAPAIFRTRSLRVRLARSGAGLVKAALPSLTGERVYQSLRELGYRWLGGLDYLRAEGVMKETLDHVLRSDTARLLKDLSSPVLLFWGKEDKQLSVKMASRVVKLRPDLECRLFSGVGHDLPFRQPERLVREIVDWISNKDRK